jgi:hypothetical protein
MIMFRALTAIAVLCLLTSPAYAATCKPGDSVQDMSKTAQIAVDTGVIVEFVLLEGEPLKRYAKSLNDLFSVGVPDTLSHIIVAVQKKNGAKIIGFNAGCLEGSANLLPGVHEKAYGEGA